MKNEQLLNKIKKEFPRLRWKTHEFYTHGWDHIVVILDRKIVFRAPKEKEYKERLEDEVRLLNYLYRKFQVKIPHYTFVSQDKSFVGYLIIPGRVLAPHGFGKISKPDKEKMAKQLALFLTTLHKTPRSIIKRYSIKVKNQHKLNRELIPDIKKIVFPRLSKRERKAIEIYFNQLRGSFNHKYKNVLTHNDLSSEHIFWDSNKKQINIIDFSDTKYTDPAIDFFSFFEYGLPFAKKVLELYDGKKNEQTIQRAEIYFKRFPLWLMKDVILGKAHPSFSFRKGHKIFRERFKV